MTTATAMQIIHQTNIIEDRTSTGKGKYWQGFAATDGEHFYTYTEFWQDGGSRQRSEPTQIAGKNIGKKNETTPREQAIAEIDAEAVKKAKKRGADLPLPMLAHSYEKRGHDIHWPCFAQPKLDGLRVMTDGERFWSRQGNLFPAECVKHLKVDTGGRLIDGELMLPRPDALKGLLANQIFLSRLIAEGFTEISVREFAFEETTSAIKKYRPGVSDLLLFHAFDINDADKPVSVAKPFEGRTADLEEWVRRCENPSYTFVETKWIADEEAARAWMGELVADGYEGIILRNPAGLYKVKDRSKDLQKWKPFVDDEFELVGCEQGSGKDIGTAIFILRTKEGKEFSARPKGSAEYRERLWRERDELVNKMVTVTYQNLTADGIPRFPVAKAIRDYE